MLVRPTKGTSNKIAIVGEAPGEDEEMLGAPFIGDSGQELTRMLSDAGIQRKEVYLTNVFNVRPSNNNLDEWCVSKKEAFSILPKYPMPALAPGKYLHPERLGAIDRLYAELNSIRPMPNVVVAMGNAACWALLKKTGINKLRGNFVECARGKYKVLPTFHPAFILRAWENRVIALFDLMKVKRDSDFPEIRRPRRDIFVPETGREAVDWWNAQPKPKQIVVDVETAHGKVHTIGFGLSPVLALTIDFSILGEDEALAWLLVWSILTDETIAKIFQNCQFDLQYLWKGHGIPVKGRIDDTMLIHHALQPELPKGLGFLGSVYTSEPGWKHMRTKDIDTNKMGDD